MPDAFIKNLFEDDKCSVPVGNSVNGRNVPKSMVDIPLRTGSYFGWMHGDHANVCVKSGYFDEASRQFCLQFPFRIKGNSLKAVTKVPECCMRKRIFSISDLTTALQSDETIECLRNLKKEEP